MGQCLRLENWRQDFRHLLSLGKGEDQKISFKCSDLSYRILCEQAHIVPAPYLARAKWVQLTSDKAMIDEDICAYIGEAYSIVSLKLTKAIRQDLGI